jgi:prolyl oligopeptidase
VSAPAEAGAAEVRPLLTEFDASYEFIDNDGPVFWFHTDLDAPRGRLVAIDTRNPGTDHWREIIPEAEETLESVGVVHNTFIATYLQDARSVVRLYALDGTPLGELPLPGIGTVAGFGGKRTDTETFFAFTSFTAPPIIYRLDMQTFRSTVYRRPTVDFDPEQFEAKQVFYPSKDGTRVPMFIIHRKGLQLNGQNPTVLYGYGGFNISLTPAFSVGMIVWLELGGVYAIANLRGGGEYGEAWHQAGMKQHKQNVFDDFIAAAEWLIANGYTSTPKLAIHGGSNGGLLVGACMTQRPDLFGACLPAVGVMDMLRFHKFTIGWGWVTDYGSPDDPEEFKALYAYSPLHNLKPGTAYPPTLITTADHDDRVVPAHSFKFAAALQAADSGGGPALIRIETKAGHGAGKPTEKVIEEIADRWAFLTRVLAMDIGEDFGA